MRHSNGALMTCPVIIILEPPSLYITNIFDVFHLLFFCRGANLGRFSDDDARTSIMIRLLLVADTLIFFASVLLVYRPSDSYWRRHAH